VSYGWTTNYDGEIANKHTLACPIWTSPDPTDACTCGADTPAARRPSTAELLDRIHATREEAT
jgi:hypothetical protein